MYLKENESKSALAERMRERQVEQRGYGRIGHKGTGLQELRIDNPGKYLMC